MSAKSSEDHAGALRKHAQLRALRYEPEKYGDFDKLRSQCETLNRVIRQCDIRMQLTPHMLLMEIIHKLPSKDPRWAAELTLVNRNISKMYAEGKSQDEVYAENVQVLVQAAYQIDGKVRKTTKHKQKETTSLEFKRPPQPSTNPTAKPEEQGTEAAFA